MVANSSNPSIQEVERDRRNCDEFKYSLGYTARIHGKPYSKKRQKDGSEVKMPLKRTRVPFSAPLSGGLQLLGDLTPLASVGTYMNMSHTYTQAQINSKMKNKNEEETQGLTTTSKGAESAKKFPKKE